jgi:competence protein ComK
MTIESIYKTYDINKETMALIPAKHIDYDTIVYETNQILYVKQRPLDMIKVACLDGGSTYDGRRVAVIHQTGAQHKVPIPINPLEKIYAFPTHSPSLYECSWIFYHHVRSIMPHPTDPKESQVLFKNGQTPLNLDISHSSLEKQLHRTSFCVVKFS